MNMSCANKNCKAELKYLRGGRLFLMERSSRKYVAETTRSKHPVTMRRYFWLCESCSVTYTIHRWTDAGVELMPRSKTKRTSVAAIVSRAWTTPGLVG